MSHRNLELVVILISEDVIYVWKSCVIYYPCSSWHDFTFSHPVRYLILCKIQFPTGIISTNPIILTEQCCLHTVLHFSNVKYSWMFCCWAWYWKNHIVITYNCIPLVLLHSLLCLVHLMQTLIENVWASGALYFF